MSKNASPLNQILRAVAKGRQRSALFWFLYQHHDEILTAAKGKLSWQHLVAEFRDLGLTDRAGSSAYVLGGVVVYSNAAKVALANVPAELIDRHGAVSPEVARALADGRIDPADLERLRLAATPEEVVRVVGAPRRRGRVARSGQSVR